MGKGKIRGISVKKNGDIIEVKLSTASHQPFYVGKARLNDKKDMIRLFRELKQKGARFPKDGDWFD